MGVLSRISAKLPGGRKKGEKDVIDVRAFSAHQGGFYHQPGIYSEYALPTQHAVPLVPEYPSGPGGGFGFADPSFGGSSSSSSSRGNRKKISQVRCQSPFARFDPAEENFDAFASGAYRGGAQEHQFSQYHLEVYKNPGHQPYNPHAKYGHHQQSSQASYQGRQQQPAVGPGGYQQCYDPYGAQEGLFVGSQHQMGGFNVETWLAECLRSAWEGTNG